ncbi:hypothetical protein [Intrasporangium flavum]|uniref:hypothetical protein n=1 Tax=Intrasporangium flavum TaxID=1428657 RepID=UPI001A97572E|nr:hypothetical protein [Intrasporangium flavum]
MPRPRRLAPRPLALAVPLVLGSLALGACGQPTPSAPDDGATVSVPVQPTILPDTATGSDDTTPSAAGDGGLFDASSSLTGVECAPGAGDVWGLTGTLKNPDSQQHTFTVAVFIVKSADGSEVVSKEVDVPLAAGASAPVSVAKLWTGPKKGVECLTGVTVKDQ